MKAWCAYHGGASLATHAPHGPCAPQQMPFWAPTFSPSARPSSSETFKRLFSLWFRCFVQSLHIHILCLLRSLCSRQSLHILCISRSLCLIRSLSPSVSLSCSLALCLSLAVSLSPCLCPFVPPVPFLPSSLCLPVCLPVSLSFSRTESRPYLHAHPKTQILTPSNALNTGLDGRLVVIRGGAKVRVTINLLLCSARACLCK